MPLESQQLDPLRRLLQQCTARVMSSTSKLHGSGVFIDDDLLLTCGHVVKGAAKGTNVRIQPYDRGVYAGVVSEIAQGKEDQDLALIDVERAEGDEPFPAAALDEAIGNNITYYAVGYPKNPIGGEVGQEEIAYTGHGSRLNSESVTMIVLQSGRATVSSGLSGGPLMNSETGAVVGLVQYSNALSSDGGGGAIPISRARMFERVKRALDPDTPPPATQRWRETLGRESWIGLGKAWETRPRVDLVVAGNFLSWRVKVDAAGCQELKVRAENLSDGVAEALFRWSQRRRIRDPDAVRLLGRLLARAVLPDAVRERIVKDLRSSVLIRMRIEEDSLLFDVPWEFVSLGANGDDKYLATDTNCGLVRVAPHPDSDRVSIAPAVGEARVAAIAAQPKKWQKYMPELQYAGGNETWPKPSHVTAGLLDAVRLSQGFRPIDVKPTPVAVEHALGSNAGTGSIEIVHYLGFGQLDPGGNSLLAFTDEDGEIETWRSTKDVFGWAAKSGARVLVVQLMLGPWNRDYEPIRPQTFLGALANRVNAVVFTRFPLHPMQCRTFNTAFYAALGCGESIESAVQRARAAVRQYEHFGDAAGFGSFTLITGPKSGAQLLTPPVEDPLRGGVRQRAGAGAQASPTPSSTAGESFAR